MSAFRIQRYLFRETAVPAFLGLAIFTFVLLMGRILRLVEMVINKGVPLGDILKLFAYLLPSFLVITFPLAFLLGILLGFGRLSADSELIALKASGFSLYGMLKPVLVLGLLVSLITGYLTLHARPAGNTAFRTQVFQIASSQASLALQPRIFNHDFEGLVIYANDIGERSGALDGVFIADERVGTTPSVIFARNGQILADRESLILTLRLEDGAIHRRPDGRGPDTYQVIDFASYDINLNMGSQLTTAEARPRRAKDLSTQELLQSLSAATAGEERNPLAVELHQRFILMLAPLLFALIAVPLGIQTQRSGRGGGFAMGLVVFLAYYILYSLAETLALDGGFPPFPTLWLPSILFLVGGSVLLHQAARERHFTFMARLNDLGLRIVRKIRRPRGTFPR